MVANNQKNKLVAPTSHGTEFFAKMTFGGIFWGDNKSISRYTSQNFQSQYYPLSILVSLQYWINKVPQSHESTFSTKISTRYLIMVCKILPRNRNEKYKKSSPASLQLRIHKKHSALQLFTVFHHMDSIKSYPQFSLLNKWSKGQQTKFRPGTNRQNINN